MLTAPFRQLLRRTFPSVVALALLAGAPLMAQEAPAICEDTGARVPRRLVDDTLRILLRRGSGQLRLDARYAMTALDALRRQFVVPEALPLPFHVPRSDSTSTLTVVASVDFIATRGGAATAVRLRRSSYVQALDAALIAAVQGASAEGAFAPFDSSETGATIPLVMEIAFGLEDSTRAGIDALVMRLPEFGRMTMPSVVEPQRLPQFRSARAAGSAIGAVHMSFAVSVEGKVLPGTVEFSRVTTPTLARAMLAVAPSWQFRPARIAGCAVAALVSQSFRFVYPP
jgi:hypothetical protein